MRQASGLVTANTLMVSVTLDLPALVWRWCQKRLKFLSFYVEIDKRMLRSLAAFYPRNPLLVGLVLP